MDQFFPFVQRFVVFVGLLILLALVNQQLFQKFIADLLVDPLAAYILKQSNLAPADVKKRLETLAATIKRLQPVLVVGAALLIAYGLNQPLTTILATIVPASLLNDPATAPIINAILIGVTSFKVHDVYEKDQANSAAQKLLTVTTVKAQQGIWDRDTANLFEKYVGSKPGG